METVTNAASNAVTAASKAIWGEQSATGVEQSGTEPVSGKTGNTDKGEPFDAGNSDSTNTESTKPTTTTTTDTTDTTTTTNTTEKPDEVAQKPATEASKEPGTEHQGAEDPKDEPEGGENDAIKATKKEAEEAASVDTSGPGPKPLSEVRHAGDHAAGPTGADPEDGPQKESKGSGTGEQYVKSSGMNADGGDFDATKPGAGREADRLLEEKGIHREEGKQKDASPEDDGPSDDKTGKKSLGDKIKAKFHKS